MGLFGKNCSKKTVINAPFLNLMRSSLSVPSLLKGAPCGGIVSLLSQVNQGGDRQSDAPLFNVNQGGDAQSTPPYYTV